MSTYRERREARAERLRGWADQRTERASATLAANDALPYAHDIAFLTQPGRIVARERLNASDDRAYASLGKAADMARRADAIEAAADHAIYSDDPDAPERLAARIAELEAERAGIAAYNASARAAAKTGGVGDPSLLSDSGRESLASVRRFASYQLRVGDGLPPYVAANLGGQISKARERLARLSAPPSARPARPARVILARYAGTCDHCGESFAAGEPIAEVRRRTWTHERCADAARSAA